ncbi:hypothetical protein K9L16_01065 [Candidatus Pacearchaeota archaeon]|nr:hypothetical protein [Candidatus Pacearchaeota archaeon]
MGKKNKNRSGRKSKIIALVREVEEISGKRILDYQTHCPLIILKSQGRGYSLDGIPKTDREVAPFIERGIYDSMTLGVKSYFNSRHLPTLKKYIKNLGVISLNKDNFQF